MLGLSYNILRIAKIPIRVHWTFGFFFLWIAYVGHQAGMTQAGVIRLCFFALVLFVCVVLHELGHAITARRYGIQTKDIIISPIGGVARLLQMPDNPRHELIIAIAGPTVNFLIALFLGIVLTLFTEQGVMPIGDPQLLFNYASNFLPALFILNLVLIVFNLIPAFPMDGGRIFRALLSMRYGKKTATRWASILGQMIALGFFSWGVYGGDYILSVIGLFVFFSAAAEFRLVQAEVLLQNQSVNDILRADFTAVYMEEPMSRAFDLRKRGEETDFMVIDQWGNVQGVLHDEFIENALSNHDHDTPVRNYMSPRYEPVTGSWRLKEVLDLFQQKGYSIIPVYSTEKMVGVVDRQALNSYIRANTGIWQNWTFK